MATRNAPKSCVKCPKSAGQASCAGCEQWFCVKHLLEHRQDLSQQMDNLTCSYDQVRQYLCDQTTESHQHPLMTRIDRWESQSVQRIKQVADEARRQVKESLDQTRIDVRKSLDEMANELRESGRMDSYTEIDLKKWINQLNALKEQLENQTAIEVLCDDSQASTRINLIQIQTKIPRKVPKPVLTTKRWWTNGRTIAGGHEQGPGFNELHQPYALDVADDGTLFIAEYMNDRVVQWKPNATQGEIIAGGKGRGDRKDRLDQPVAVVIDRFNRCLIVSEEGNRRVMRWPLGRQRSDEAPEVIISDVRSFGLAMDDEGSLYVSDYDRHVVYRYGRRDSIGAVVVAGGHGQGAALRQLNQPRHIFVDAHQTVYVSDGLNHRVMKWVKNAERGVVVAGDHGAGDRLNQLNCPSGILVDAVGSVYVVDQGNHRVMRWSKGAQEGEVIFGGYGQGANDNQLNHPAGIVFDNQGNLYVADFGNNRVQCFDFR